MDSTPSAVKDRHRHHPIAAAWRPMLREVVRALAEGDYGLARGVSGVDTVPGDLAAHIKSHVEDYGETLIDLPDETWDTSCAQWMDGHWEVVVDLRTQGEGRSDLVMTGKMAEVDGALRFTLWLVHVP